MLSSKYIKNKTIKIWGATTQLGFLFIYLFFNVGNICMACSLMRFIIAFFFLKKKKKLFNLQNVLKLILLLYYITIKNSKKYILKKH
jgi:hypothetical protein